MNNNLSKQLCEICGLKYCKEKVVINEGQCPNVDIKPFYLNFEQPENFVRLLEVLSNYMYDDDRGISISKNYVSLGDPILLKTDESEKELNIMQKVLKLLLNFCNK